MYYFGTNLSGSKGHYLNTLNGHNMTSQHPDVYRSLPFNPEIFPTNGDCKARGDVMFYGQDGYTICAIDGSIIDTRPGSKCVFFIKESLSPKELFDKIIAIPIGKKIIESLPFKVKWGWDTLMELSNVDPKRDKLERELTSLLNKECLENESDTPDFVLAKYLLNCLASYNAAVKSRDKYWGVKMSIEHGAIKTK